MYRTEQDLDDQLDLTLEEYKEAGNLHDDYRVNRKGSFWATCDYDFLKHLQVGDILQLTKEETGNLSPLVISVELDEDNFVTKLLKVTRKIYSASGLDVYVAETEDE
jgi:hypothetical protein